MEPAAPDLLSGFPIVIELPVQWGDQDAFGHVNNTIYIRWFESARIAYSDRMGLSEMLATQRVGPILAAINCNFRRPVNYPDTVQVGARISRIGRTSLTMEHRVCSHSLQAVVAEGDSTVVVFDYAAGKPRPIPDELRATIERLEGRTLSNTSGGSGG